ncbi:hypothetical protein JT27_15010 [Alcaligenes faecalis]|uniref:hypothetical protein n=1 Tax=Alcaligenes faecalis TaxID=511 RepID=UPI00052B9A4B|nr:hypothetical protein [Alcaligenes faecalis]KGP01106.1 hypothetical protein JT27_15010 [Alcaligenes faecalis]
MSNETIAWKICYTENGQYRTALSEHNSVGDYRAIDPMASSIALCAAPVSAEPLAWRCEWPHGHVQHHDQSDPMPESWDDPPISITPLYAAPVAAQAQPITPADAVYGLLAWLSGRDEVVTLSARHGAAIASDLAKAFCEANGLQQFSPDYPDNLKYPKSTLAQQPVSGAGLREALRHLIRGYVNLMENGRDRILFLGGQCDPVDVMEASDPWLKSARAALAQQDEPKLDKPAKVGAGRFGVGIKWSTVIAAAQRLHAYEVTPEKEAERIAGAEQKMQALRHHIAAQAQQDADKVDAERWRAYRAAAAGEDGEFLERVHSHLSSLGLRDQLGPTENQIDAAIDAARKEVQA